MGVRIFDRAKQKLLGTPDFGYEKNVNIQYPLDPEERVDVGGDKINRLTDDMSSLKDTMQMLMVEIRLNNLYLSHMSNQQFTEEDLDDAN